MMSKLNIHQKVSLMAQSQKSKIITQSSSSDEKLDQYEQEIKPNLSEDEKILILKYLEKLCTLGKYRVII